LTGLYLDGNQLTNLTLPADLTSLTTRDLGAQPLLKTFALSELLAVTGLAAEVALLRGQGVSVHLYPVALAQEGIPDPVLNGALRKALGKATGDITVQDMEGLSELDASVWGRGGGGPIRSLKGLEPAKNLTSLNLAGLCFGCIPAIELTDFAPLAGLTNLTTLDLGQNQLTDYSFLSGLTSLTSLYLDQNYLSNFSFLSGLTNLTTLDLSYNRLTDFSFLIGLTNLTSLSLDNNQLTGVTLPAGLTSLTSLYLGGNRLTNFSFLSGLTSLTTLNLYYNQLTSLTLPAGLTNLAWLQLSYNQLTNFSFLSGLTSLTELYLNGNQLTNLTLPANLTSLQELELGAQPLLETFALSKLLAVTRLADQVALLRGQGVSVYLYPSPLAEEVPIPDPGLNAAIRETLGKSGLLIVQDLLRLTDLNAEARGVSNLEGLEAAPNLTSLRLGGNRLINFSLPAGLTNLTTLDLHNNQLTNLTLPAGLTSLKALDLGGNQLTKLTLPTDLTRLIALRLDNNPLLKTLVLPEELAVTALANQVANLTGQGVSIYVYRRLEGGRVIQFPLTVSLDSGRRTTAGTFQFALTGPPGAYTILGSADLAAWSELGTLTNKLGIAVFIDLTVTNSLQNFYRVRPAP
jgi:internalin A